MGNMTLLIDTNILLDVLTGRKPYCEGSSKIWKLCETGQCTGYISALSIPNLVYILRKELSPERVGEVLLAICEIFEVEPLYLGYLLSASDMRWKDYEDAIQYATASSLHSDYIVTRNHSDFLRGSIPTISPEEFLQRI